VFITLEGIDRSGKTTQAARLAAALGPDTLLVREPGGTEAGERIRSILMDPAVALNPGAELLLFSAARSELATRVIAPAKSQERDIVSDRYVDSTAAYQGAAIGAFFVDAPGFEGRNALEIGIDLIEGLNRLVIGECVPDLTVLLRVDADVAGSRGQQGLPDGGLEQGDRFEGRGIEFQRELAAAYDVIAARHPERIVAIDGEGPPEEVHAAVMAEVSKRRSDDAHA
jgi:dTMP kinase